MNFIFSVLFCFLFSQTSYAADLKKAVVSVEGLVCDFCARAVEKVFGKREEVDSINVDLNTKKITVSFKPGKELEDKALASLIKDAGYSVAKITRE